MAQIDRFLFSSKNIHKDIPVIVISPMRTVQDPFVVILLHGAMESGEVILTQSDVVGWADQYNMTIVLPSLGNCFYVAASHSFLVEELFPYLVNEYFPQLRKENTAIGGYSMGGFGALYNGLMRPDLFSQVFSISGALDLPFCVRFVSYLDPNIPSYVTIPKKDLEEKYDLRPLLSPKNHQRCYLSCGSQDMLTFINQRFVKELDDRRIDHSYCEKEGNHDWNFWSKELHNAFQWLHQSR